MKLLLLPLVTFLSIPLFVFAQGKVYSPLVDLSNAGQGNDVQTFESYINFLYGMSIAVAALLAVIKIIIAGTKYMLDDVISGKEDAKKDIQGAVLGLLLILSAVIILELINPELIDKKIKFDPLPKRPDVTAPALTTANGQTPQEVAEELFQGLDGCAIKHHGGISASGNFTIDVVNAEPCGDNAAAQLSLFEKNCAAKGGEAYLQGNTGIMVCPTPVSIKPAVSISDLEDYGKLFGYDPKNEYVSLEKNIMTYRATEQCKAETGTVTGTEFTKCMRDLRIYLLEPESDDVQDVTGFCIHKGGKPSSDDNNYICELPTWKRTADEMKSAYLDSLPATANKVWDKAAFNTACSNANGVLKDLQTTAATGVDDYLCVKY